MLKKIFYRAAISAPIATVVHQIITIIVSIARGDGRYFPIAPAFASLFSNDITPIVVQLILVGLIGATFAGSSVLFDIESWSFLKQGFWHLAITSVVLIPVCLLCWRPVNFTSAMALVISWLFVYGCTWLSQYFTWRCRIRKLNARIQLKNRRHPS